MSRKEIHRSQDLRSRSSTKWARCTVEGIGVVVAYLSVVTVLVYPLFRAL